MLNIQHSLTSGLDNMKTKLEVKHAGNEVKINVVYVIMVCVTVLIKVTKVSFIAAGGFYTVFFFLLLVVLPFSASTSTMKF